MPDSSVAIVCLNIIHLRMITTIHHPANDEPCMFFRIQIFTIHIPEKVVRKAGD